MKYFIHNEACILPTGHKQTSYGFTFRVVAELPDGRRFNHFYQETASFGCGIPSRVQRLLSRVQESSPNVEGRRYWHETWPVPGSPAHFEVLADMDRAERARDEQNNRHVLGDSRVC